jgi:hypothetical protein
MLFQTDILPHLIPGATAKEPPETQDGGKLPTWGIRATPLISGAFAGRGLENKRRRPLKPWQNRDCGIEKGPIPEIVM